MTELGKYFNEKLINRSAVSRKTGISGTRLSELSNNTNTKFTVLELYLIATSIGVTPCELLEVVCKKFTLKNTDS